MKYKILFDYGCEGMKFYDEKEFDTVDEAVKFAVSLGYGTQFMIVTIAWNPKKPNCQDNTCGHIDKMFEDNPNMRFAGFDIEPTEHSKPEEEYPIKWYGAEQRLLNPDDPEYNDVLKPQSPNPLDELEEWIKEEASKTTKYESGYRCGLEDVLSKIRSLRSE